MADPERHTFAWMDLLWLAFLGGLALTPPLFEIHKQLTLLAIGALQILEHRLLVLIPSRGRAYSVILKIVLATLLMDHTEGINSSYYLIYFLPAVTAAMFFDAAGTLLWTAIASAAYCSLLIPALFVYTLTPEALTELAIRNLFFFLAAIVVNRFVTENRRQSERYRQLAETLAETNRRLAEAQEEARRSERLAALGQMSAGLAHEIRNPLAVIRGSAETVQRKLQSADPLTTELAGYISSEVSRLNIIVTRFLDFARPLKPQALPQAVTPLVERALKAVRDRWPDARVEVERHFAEPLPNVNVDPDLCEQVFTNLVQNAYEAMASAGGRLRVVAAAASFDGRHGVEITFEDTGPGVPAELREQIFNPLFTTKEHGVGLGLSIVSKIVDEHRGTLRLCSQEGQGACFKIFLPAE